MWCIFISWHGVIISLTSQLIQIYYYFIFIIKKHSYEIIQFIHINKQKNTMN